MKAFTSELSEAAAAQSQQLHQALSRCVTDFIRDAPMHDFEDYELAAAVMLALEITAASAISTFGQHESQKIAHAFGERVLARVSVLSVGPDDARHLQ